MIEKTIAILVGTGLWKSLGSLPLQTRTVYQNIKVHFGHRQGEILHYEIGFYRNLRVIILPRHGARATSPQRSPAELALSQGHEAHIWFLSKMGVDEIYALNTVGALDPALPLADTDAFLLPDDLAYELGTAVHSFGPLAKFPHPAMHEVFSPALRENLKEALLQSDAYPIEEGTYIYSNLDHLETRAEGMALRQLYKGAANPVVGSTAGAEAVLSKEMGLNYAVLCSISNPVQGVSDENVDHQKIMQVMDTAGRKLTQIVENLLEIASGKPVEELCQS